MKVQVKDHVIIKAGAHVETHGLDCTALTGKVERVYPEIGPGIALVDFGGQLVKLRYDEIEVISQEEKEAVDKMLTDKIEVTLMEWCQAQLKVCTPDYVKSHIDFPESVESDCAIVAASGPIILSLMWDYLREAAHD